jgi:hypothetical protein
MYRSRRQLAILRGIHTTYLGIQYVGQREQSLPQPPQLQGIVRTYHLQLTRGKAIITTSDRLEIKFVQMLE